MAFFSLYVVCVVIACHNVIFRDQFLDANRTRLSWSEKCSPEQCECARLCDVPLKHRTLSTRAISRGRLASENSDLTSQRNKDHQQQNLICVLIECYCSLDYAGALLKNETDPDKMISILLDYKLISPKCMRKCDRVLPIDTKNEFRWVRKTTIAPKLIAIRPTMKSFGLKDSEFPRRTSYNSRTSQSSNELPAPNEEELPCEFSEHNVCIMMNCLCGKFDEFLGWMGSHPMADKYVAFGYMYFSSVNKSCSANCNKFPKDGCLRDQFYIHTGEKQSTLKENIPEDRLVPNTDKTLCLLMKCYLSPFANFALSKKTCKFTESDVTKFRTSLRAFNASRYCLANCEKLHESKSPTFDSSATKQVLKSTSSQNGCINKCIQQAQGRSLFPQEAIKEVRTECQRKCINIIVATMTKETTTVPTDQPIMTTKQHAVISHLIDELQSFVDRIRSEINPKTYSEFSAVQSTTILTSNKNPKKVNEIDKYQLITNDQSKIDKAVQVKPTFTPPKPQAPTRADQTISMKNTTQKPTRTILSKLLEAEIQPNMTYADDSTNQPYCELDNYHLCVAMRCSCASEQRQTVIKMANHKPRLRGRDIFFYFRGSVTKHCSSQCPEYPRTPCPKIESYAPKILPTIPNIDRTICVLLECHREKFVEILKSFQHCNMASQDIVQHIGALRKIKVTESCYKSCERRRFKSKLLVNETITTHMHDKCFIHCLQSESNRTKNPIRITDIQKTVSIYEKFSKKQKEITKCLKYCGLQPISQRNITFTNGTKLIGIRNRNSRKSIPRTQELQKFNEKFWSCALKNCASESLSGGNKYVAMIRNKEWMSRACLGICSDYVNSTHQSNINITKSNYKWWEEHIIFCVENCLTNKRYANKEESTSYCLRDCSIHPSDRIQVMRGNLLLSTTSKPVLSKDDFTLSKELITPKEIPKFVSQEVFQMKEALTAAPQTVTINSNDGSTREYFIQKLVTTQKPLTYNKGLSGSQSASVIYKPDQTQEMATIKSLALALNDNKNASVSKKRKMFLSQVSATTHLPSNMTADTSTQLAPTTTDAPSSKAITPDITTTMNQVEITSTQPIPEQIVEPTMMNNLSRKVEITKSLEEERTLQSKTLPTKLTSSDSMNESEITKSTLTSRVQPSTKSPFLSTKSKTNSSKESPILMLKPSVPKSVLDQSQNKKFKDAIETNASNKKTHVKNGQELSATGITSSTAKNKKLKLGVYSLQTTNPNNLKTKKLKSTESPLPTNASTKSSIPCLLECLKIANGKLAVEKIFILRQKALQDNEPSQVRCIRKCESSKKADDKILTTTKKNTVESTRKHAAQK